MLSWGSGNSVLATSVISEASPSESAYYIDASVSALAADIQLATAPGHSFQLFTHGRPGELLIDNQWMTAPEITKWLQGRLRLHDRTHLNIYGCEFGKGAKGLAAVQYLERALGVTVAASDDVTGANGDWDLEVGIPKDVLHLPAYAFNLQDNVKLPLINNGSFSGLTVSNNVSGFLCIGSVANPARIVDNDAGNFGTLSLTGANCVGVVSVIDGDVGATYPAGSFAGFRIDASNFLPSVTIAAEITIATYLDGNPTGDNVTPVTSSIGVNTSLVEPDGTIILGMITTQPYDEIRITFNALLGVLFTTDIYHAVIETFAAGPALDCNVQTPMNNPTYPTIVNSAETGITGVVCAGCTVSGAENVISVSTADFATIVMDAGIAATGSISVQDVLTNYPAGGFAGFNILNADLVGADLLSGLTVTTFLDGTQQETASLGGGNLISANSSLLTGIGTQTVGFVTMLPYDEVKLSVTNLLGVVSTTEVYGAVFESFCAGPALDCNVQTAMNAPTYPTIIDNTQTGISDLACVACTVTNTGNVISSDPNDYATISLGAGVGLAQTASIAVQDVLTDYAAGGFAGFNISNSNLINADVLAGITITTYLNGVQQETSTTPGVNLLSVNSSLLSTGSGDQLVGIITMTQFDEVKITISNVLGVLNETLVYNAVFEGFCAGPPLDCGQNVYLTNPDFPVIVNNEISSLACVGCAVNDLNNIIDADTDNYASVDLTAGVGSTVTISVEDVLTVGYPAGTVAGFDIENLNLLGVDLINGAQVTTYLNGVEQEDSDDGTLLSLQLFGGGRQIVGFTTALPFDEVRLTVRNFVGVDLGLTRVYGAVLQEVSNAGVTPPVLTGDGGSGVSVSNVCPDPTFDLSSLVATVPAGAQLVWFTTNDYPPTGVSYATPSAATAGTYYAYYYDAVADCYSPPSNAVTVSISDCVNEGRILEWSIGEVQVSCGPTTQLCYPLMISINDESLTPELATSTIRFFYDAGYLSGFTVNNVENAYAPQTAVISGDLYGGVMGFAGGGGAQVQFDLVANDANPIALSSTPVHVLDLCFNVDGGVSYPLCAPIVFDNNHCGWDFGLAADDGYLQNDAGMAGTYYLNGNTADAILADDEVINYLWTEDPGFDCRIDELDDMVGATDNSGCLEDVCNAEISIIKTGTYDPIDNEIDYVYTVTNTGPATLYDVTVTENGGTFTGTNGAPTPVFDSGGADLGGDPGIADLAPGEMLTYIATYPVSQADIDAGSVTNQATATGTPSGTDPVTDLSDDNSNLQDEPTVVTITQDDALLVTKSVVLPLAPLVLGNNIEYLITVTNIGNTTLTNVAVTDPNADNVLVLPLTTLLPGLSTAVVATHEITQADIDQGYVENSALGTAETLVGGDPVSDVSDTATDRDGDPVVNNEANETPDGDGATDSDPTNDPTVLDLNPVSELTVTKGVVLPLLPLIVGNDITYTITVTNTGNTTLTNIDVVETNATITLGVNPIPVLLPGASAVFTATHQITQADIDLGYVENTVTATGNSPFGTDDVTDDSDTATDRDGDPVVNNEANETPDGDGTTDSDPTNDPTVLDLNPVASMSVIKSVSSVSGTEMVGDVISYDIEVTNTGNVTLSDIEVADANAVVSGSPIASLAPGASTTLTATHQITQADIDQGYVQNTAIATGDSPTGTDDVTDVSDAGTDEFGDPIANPEGIETQDGAGNTNGDPADDPTVYLLQQIAAIQTTKSFTDIDGNPAITEYSAVNEVINYQITVSNAGNVTIYNVNVTDANADGGSITLVSGDAGNDLILGVGETWVYTAAHTVVQADIDAGMVVNVATGSGSADTDGDNTGDTPVSDDSDQVVVNALCVDFNLFVYLEGSLIVPQTGQYQPIMRTTLNDSKLLPGQYSVNVFQGNLYTPPLGTAGQVYNITPWNYDGGEGALYDSGGSAANADAGYPSTVTDWVLVSLRTDPQNGSEAVCRRAALLHNDGRIEFVGDHCCTLDRSQSYYVVVEHRNHLIVMSDVAVPIIDGTMTYDFRDKPSYLYDPFISGSFITQKQVLPGIYAMYAGNGDQDTTADDDADTDILSSDYAKWLNNNPENRVFKLVDYNMDGDISALDFELWQSNSPRFTSVPRD
ncbi:MAG: DUF4347 domain-containing protein [Saprospiraceae bacterium]